MMIAVFVVLASVAFVPQAHRVWRVRHDDRALLGSSMSSAVLMLVSSALCTVVGLSAGLWWLILAGLINVVCAGLVLAVLYSSRSRLSRQAEEGVTGCPCGWTGEGEHDWVSTGASRGDVRISPCPGQLTACDPRWGRPEPAVGSQ